MKHKKSISAWPDEAIGYLVKNYATEDFEVMEKFLNKGKNAIRSYALKLGLKRAKWEWKPSEDVYVLENYNSIDIKDLIKELGRTRWAIINRYRELSGIRKSKGKNRIISSISSSGLAAVKKK